MKNENKRVSVFFWVFLLLIAVLFFGFIELSKNTIIGWIIAILLFILYVVLEIKVIKKRKPWVRFLAWLGFFVVLGLSALISQPPYKTVPAVDNKNPEKTSVISLADGDIQGVYSEDKNVEVYAGIPYAKPPVGELRWKEPQEPEKWSGVRDCSRFAPMSMQKRNSEFYNSMTRIIGYHDFKIDLHDNYREAVSEDSLYINVWKPSGEIKGAPVLVFIHGGSLTTGQPSFSEYRGEDLARKGIIVVNFGYRLNVFGYMANDELKVESPNSTTGNYGLLDQIQALKWVQKNIASFGGDNTKVTVAGESAGSSSVNAICVSPLAKGLFRYAIGESSGITPIKPYHTFRDFDEAISSGKKTLEEFDAKSISDLREIPADKLVKTSASNSAMTVDGYAITEQPYLTYEKGNNNETALLNGYNSHEANVFNLFDKVDDETYKERLDSLFGDYAGEVYKLCPPEKIKLDYNFAVEQGGSAKGAYNYVLGGTWFAYSHKTWSDYVAKQNKPVYFYYFNKDNKSLRANHAGELPYAYGNLWRHGYLYDNADYKLSDEMQNYWANFVKTGNPNGGGSPEWKQYTEKDKKILKLDSVEKIEMIDDPYSDLYEIIDKSQSKNK